jgi:predicted peptidase
MGTVKTLEGTVAPDGVTRPITNSDEVVPVETSRKMVKALRDGGGEPKYTEYPGVDHYSWGLAYRDPELIEWFFGQSREPSES